MCVYSRCYALSKKTFEIAISHENDILTQVKENQPILLDNCKSTERLLQPSAKCNSKVSKQHGRIEQRKLRLYTDISLIEDTQWQQLIKSIIVVDRHREIYSTLTKQWQSSDETSYYVFSNAFHPKIMHKIIRNHWWIENKNNYVRDVSLKEDASKIRTNPGVFSRMRSYTLNILRANKVNTVKQTLYKNSLSLSFLNQLLI